MKKGIYSIVMLLALMATALTSCSDDEVVKTPLNAPTLAEGIKTVSSLAFNWNAVDGATQYAYELRNPEGSLVLGNMTSATSMIATGLKDNTTYTLTVWAYAAVTGTKTTSPVATITATTNQIVPLGNPVPEAAPGNGGITISWPEVEHAAYYAYSYMVGDETVEGTTETNSVTLKGMPVGEYTIYITAISTDEAYSNSETIALTFQRAKAELWRMTGNYNSEALGQDFECDIVAYDDGSYTIEKLYGSDDKLDFSVDGNSELVIQNAYSVDAPYYYVQAGDYTLCLYIASGYSAWEGNRAAGGVWFYAYLYDSDSNYLGGGYDYMTWGDTEEGMTIDDLCGEYTETTNCYDFTIDFTNWTEVTDQVSDVTITKTGDNTVSIDNFYGWEDTFTATVDMDARTITVDVKSDWGGYYTFADYSDATKAVVATFDEEGTITFNNWAAWYNGYQYTNEGAESILTKK